MKTLLRLSMVLACTCSASGAFAQSGSALDLFRYDPVSFFAGSSGQMWVGNIRFMLQDYSDTLKLTVDSAGKGLVINRVLVRMADTAVVSRGSGTITPNPGGETYAAAWIERTYDEATGLMQWGDGQWEISFTGEWKQWFINVRQESDASFTAGLARAVGNFSPVELTQMTYFMIPAKR